MKKSILLLVALIALSLSCSNEPMQKEERIGLTASEFEEIQALFSRVDNLEKKVGEMSKGAPIKDPADSNTKKIMFEPTVEGTFEERLASLQITSAHAKPVSLNWNFLGNVDDEELKSGENLEVLYVILYEKDKPTQWIAQTATSGWRGFWVAQSYGLESGKTYVLWFQTYDIKVEFVMPKGKI